MNHTAFALRAALCAGLVALFAGLALPGATAPASAGLPASAAVRQADPTSAPDTAQPTPTAAPRRRLQAPPLPPATGALLVLSNVVLAIGLVFFALYLRRRRK